MALTVPSFIPEPFANEGQYATIPDTPSSEQGRASWQQGFPQVCAQPLASGGIPPNYLDFQGIFNALSAHLCYSQTGALWPWSATLTYPLGAHVIGSDNNEYVAVQGNTGQDPTQDADDSYWARVAETPDGVTIVNNSANRLMAQDIAIGGNTGDLASARGQIGSAQYKTGVDLNDIIEAGFYIISTKTPNQNAPVNTNMYLQVLKNQSFGVIQIAYTLNKSASVPCYVRRMTASGGGTWMPWVQFVDVANIGDGITVNNGIISVPEYEGATDSAAGTSGLVPPAAAGDQDKVLRGDGTWQTPTSAMPVGSVYVQFAGQSAPADLFGGTWSNVSSTYAGLFFRAEGGDAAAFGSVQTGGLPNITGTFDRAERNGFAPTSGVFYNPNQGGSGYARDEPISSANVGFNASRCSGLYGASEEVRPVNSAIRIWKRTA